jgi:hypothetical protein
VETPTQQRTDGQGRQEGDAFRPSPLHFCHGFQQTLSFHSPLLPKSRGMPAARTPTSPIKNVDMRACIILRCTPISPSPAVARNSTAICWQNKLFYSPVLGLNRPSHATFLFPPLLLFVSYFFLRRLSFQVAHGYPFVSERQRSLRGSTAWARHFQY